MDIKKDPITNAIHNGIKRGIRVAIESQCPGSAVILIYSGIDTVAFLSMAPKQNNVRMGDFVEWAGRYIRFRCRE